MRREEPSGNDHDAMVGRHVLDRRLEMRRGHNISAVVKQPLFYAPLTSTTVAAIAHDSDTSVYDESYNSISSAGLRITAAGHGIRWNCSVPVGMNLTFSCWVNRTGGQGVNYSFGAATQNNARYKGLQLSQYSSYWLMQEYLYFCSVGTNFMTETNVYVFLSWTIIYNGNNSYTCKFYKNGVLIETRTFTNTNWQGMSDRCFAISHFTNSMYAYYKHFSCYEELTDAEVMSLYQRGGEPE